VNDRDEQWSPDGRFIAFRRVVGSSDDIWILNVRTKKTIKVTSDSKKDREPNWSPDSKRLAFVRGSGKTARVWIVELNADGSASEAKPLWADDPAGEWLPAWSAR
jgi:TolB protein